MSTLAMKKPLVSIPTEMDSRWARVMAETAFGRAMNGPVVSCCHRRSTQCGRTRWTGWLQNRRQSGSLQKKIRELFVVPYVRLHLETRIAARCQSHF